MAGDGIRTKRWYQSRTIWFNVASGVLALISGSPGLIPLDPQILATVVAVGNVALRTVTGQPLGK
jgi:hypothetical protein